MNKLLYLFLCIATLNSCDNSNSSKSSTSIVPRPTGPRKERKKIKKAYFENMHRAEEGFNWKQYNKEQRWNNYKKRKNTKSEISVNGFWKERGSANQAGRIHTAELDTLNNILYCASSGGNIWKGTPEGEDWISLNDEIKFHDIKMLKLIQMDSLNRLVVCTGKSEFYYTDNEGETWNQSSGLENIVSWGHIKKAVAVCDSINSIYLIASEWNDFTNSQVVQLYRSQDQGSSFSGVKRFTTNIDRVDIWAPSQYSDTTVIVADNLFYTIAGNDNYPDLQSYMEIGSAGHTLLTGCATEENTILYAYLNGDIHRSTDNGASYQNWELIGDRPTEPFFSMSFSCSANNPNQLYIGGVECFVSNTGGASWNAVNAWWDYYDNPEEKLHADIPNIKSVLSSGGEEIIYVATDGGLYKSTDSLETVKNISLKDLNVGQYYSSYTNRNNTDFVYLGSQDQGFQRTDEGSSDSTFNFNQVISGDYGHIVSGDGGESIWMVYPGFADYYPNAETGETADSWYFPEEATQLWLPPLMADPNFPTTAYLAGGNINDFGSHIIRLDFGNSISSTQLNYNFEYWSGGGYITAMACSKINTNYWYVLTNNGKFFSSTDYGETWTKTGGFTGPENHYFYGASIQASAIELGKVYIAGSGYSNPGVYMSTDNGDSFTALDQGLPSTMIYDIAPSLGDEYIFAATELGPFVYTSETNQWSDLSAGLAPDQIYWTVEFVDEIKTARFGTYGRGIWDFKLEEETSSVALTEVNKIDFKLYPVPTSNNLNIELSTKEQTTIEIYDLQGKLILKQKTEDTKTLSIDVSNIEKGTYLCKINEQSKTFVKL